MAEPPPLTRWQIGGAIVFPVVGLAGDFYLTKVWINAPWIYAVGWSIGAAALLLSARAAPGSRAQDIAVGAMAACAAGAAIIGVVLLPYTMILFFFLGVGLLGLAPFCVAVAHASRVRVLWRGWRAVPFASVGAAIFAVPLLIQIYEWSWVDRQLEALKSSDPAVVETALRALNDYPLNFGRFAIPACWSLVIYANVDYRAYPGLAREVERMLGPNPADCDTGDPHS
jgi:hypothetical protein